MTASRNHPIVSISLAVAILSLCQAAQAIDFAGGTGEPNNPYLIATKEQLLAIGSNSSLTSKCFKLVSDVNLAGLDFFAPIVSSFSGTFDGNGHAVRNLHLAGFSNLGLFGSVASGGRILNLSLPDADILSTQYAGALAGQNAGTIQHCDSTGSVVSVASYSYGAGGLVGYNTGIVTDSRSAADVTGYYYVGGLVGSNSGIVSGCATAASVFGYEYVGSLVGYNAGTISTSYADSDSDTMGYYYTGGLVGCNSGGAISNCYSTGSITGYYYVGGLVGYHPSGRLYCCYSIASVTVTGTSSSVGYLVGSGSSNITACYYVPLHPISGGSVNTIGTALTSQQMKQRTNLVGWDFWGITSDGTADVWFMPQDAFPVFAWQTDTTGLVAVPDIAGLPLDEAKLALTAAGLTAGVVTQDYHRTIPAGNVISTGPHCFALPGSTVDLVLSKGATYDWAGNPGNGSAANPYQIQSAGQSESLGDHSELWNKCFVLMADLDMSGRTYSTALIAPDVYSVEGFQGTTFTGSFNGNGYAIQNLLISRDSSTGGTYFGLFGIIDNTGMVTGLSLKNATVITGASTSATYVGALAGLSGGTIVNCSATGIIMTDSNSAVGGLVGYSHGSIVNCQTDVVIARSTSTDGGAISR